MNNEDIKIEHWITRYPHDDTANESRLSNADGWLPLFRFRSDYRLVSFTYLCSFLSDPIDLTGKKQ